ncbi:hypothetical protein AAF712_005915 [Marasmius tenuissimus]|uniref:Uncharacterized protein n=1 Tax=Marasmius tenuissimus TaxID=585030 RepID=A0ABR3A266_9AGAR
MQVKTNLLSLIVFLGFSATLSVAQNSCTAVAYLGHSGNSCTGAELGDAKQDGNGFGACELVTNAQCVLTEQSEGDCAIHLYSDTNCQTAIGGGNTIMCGEASQNVDFTSFRIECA